MSASFAYSVLLVSSLVFLPYTNFVTGTISAVVVSTVYLLAWLTRIRFRVLNGPLFWFVVMVVTSIFWAENPALTVNYVGATTIAALAGFAIGSTLQTNDILKIIERTIGTIAVLSLVLYFLAPGYALDQDSVNKGTLIGIYAQKNILAFVLVIGLVTTLFQKSHRTTTKYARLLLLCIYSFDLWLTQSSTGFAISATCVFLRILAPIWLREAKALRQVTAMGIIILLPIAVIGTIQSLDWILELFGKDPTISSRTVRWSVLIEAWKHKPWLGFGWGAFATDSSIADSQQDLYGHVALNAQNGFLQVLAELGVIGAALFFLVFLTAIRSNIRALIAAKRIADFWPALVIIAVLLNNGFEQGTRGAQLFMLALIVGLLTQARNKHQNH